MDSWIKQEGTLRGDVPQVLDFVAATQDHWDTFIQAPFDVPQTLVFGSRASVLLGSRRRGYFNELDGNSTFSALFRVHQVPVYMADEYTDWVDLSRFKVVFACGEIMTGHAIDRLVDFVESGGRLVLVGNAGYYNTDDPSSTNVLAGRLAGAMTNVRSIPEPERMVIDSQYDASDAPYEFDAGELETLLSWAGVERPAEVVSQAVAGFPGFEVSTRRNAAGDQVYVGAMRSWFGGYGDHIETQAQVDAQCAKAAGSVVLHGLADGTWQISKFHRDERSLGTASAVGGKLSFATDPAEAAEVQLFVLTRE